MHRPFSAGTQNAKAGDNSDERAKKEGIDNSFSVAADRIQEVEITVMKGEDAKAGDKALTFPEFLEAIVACALFRANPKLGELGHDDAEYPLPECFEKLLHDHILKNAKRDAIALIKSSLETDADVQALMADTRKKLQDKTDAAGLTNKIARSFDDVTKVGVRKICEWPRLEPRTSGVLACRVRRSPRAARDPLARALSSLLVPR